MMELQIPIYRLEFPIWNSKLRLPQGGRLLTLTQGIRRKHVIYDFRGFNIDSTRRVLLRHGAQVAISPKCLDLLVFLVDNRDRLVEKSELLKGLWPDIFV